MQVQRCTMLGVRAGEHDKSVSARMALPGVTVTL